MPKPQTRSADAIQLKRQTISNRNCRIDWNRNVIEIGNLETSDIRLIHWIALKDLLIDVMGRSEERLSKKGVYANVDFYSGILYQEIGIPVDLFTPIFAVSRTSGWLAHWIEQVSNNKIFRPTQNYIGQEPRELKK